MYAKITAQYLDESQILHAHFLFFLDSCLSYLPTVVEAIMGGHNPRPSLTDTTMRFVEDILPEDTTATDSSL